MLVDAFTDGGMERVTIDLCRSLRHKGYLPVILVATKAGRSAERHGWKDTPRYAAARPGDFSLKRGSPGWQKAERLPNFNDRYERPDVGAQQSGAPQLRFGLRAAGEGAE